MTSAVSRLDRWLPQPTRRGVLQRGAIVWSVSLAIALVQWSLGPHSPALDSALVYSYAISTSIWFLTDPMRIVLHRWLGTTAPNYWALSGRVLAYVLAGIALGYAVGTSLGDLYTGRSTWELMMLSPQRFWAFWWSSLGISFGFLFYFYHREKSRELQRQATETRLKLLESQLEPHMLFNTLANLRALIGTDPERATAMLDRLNGYLRATLKASRTEATTGSHTLADEFARLRDYLELMAVRMGPRLRYTLDLPQELAGQSLPPLLLQPLVENCIRHGLEPSLEGGEVRVTARLGGSGALEVEVSDTGVGCEPEPRAGFGHTQVRERLETAYAGRARLQWQSRPGGGTRALLTLPLKAP
jgi:signal transduction histidine kinase